MIYLDTSVAVPLFVHEAHSATVDAWFESNTEALVASDWIRTEFASALALKQRRGEITAAQARGAWEGFESLCAAGLKLAPVSRQAFDKAASLARVSNSGLRAGDALHLAVALETGAARIATLDAVLAANAGRHGLAAVTF
jgi:predicted nucleic acid-binding protein